MKDQIKIKYYSPQAFKEVKEAAWSVCGSLYEMEEEHFYFCESLLLASNEKEASVARGYLRTTAQYRKTLTETSCYSQRISK